MATIRSLLDILIDPQPIFPELRSRLPSAFVFSNESEFDKNWAQHLVSGAYAERMVVSQPVRFGRLPPHATLRGGNHFMLCAGDDIVGEYVPHVFRNNLPALLAELRTERPLIETGEECVLLARFGHNTWGHWAGELLPIAVALETRWPGRFLYAVPQSGHPDYITGMLQSLAFYGIGLHRLLWLRQGFDHRLHKAWAMTPIWSDNAPHPAALDTLRRPTRNLEANGPAKLALLRRDWPTRGISNIAEVADLLETEGFQLAELAGMRFADQVRLFASAEIVFGVLGSGLTGLVYSPDNVAVVAASPTGFSDRFFYALAQRRGGTWADVKGPSRWNGRDGLKRDAPFDVPIDVLRQALAAI
jgi:hypothetical protein